MKKRILALLTAVMMLSSAVPALADEASTVTDGYKEVLVAEDFDHFISVSQPSVSGPAAAGTVGAGHNYLGNMSGGKGVVFTQMDFGDGADELILDVKLAFSKTSSAPISTSTLEFRVINDPIVLKDGENYLNDYNIAFKGDKFAEANPIKTGGWEAFEVRHYPVTDAQKLQGIKNIAMFVGGDPNSFGNVYSFQINKPVSPYQQLLADEVITSGKEIKSLDFDTLGAEKVTLTYNEGATGTVSIYKDTINGFYLTNDFLVETINLDGSGNQIVELNRETYNGYADLYFKVSDGVELSQIEFSEYKMPDNFNGKSEINALYIGNGEWSSETKAAFEEKNEFDGRTFNNIDVDLSTMTDVEYVESLHNLNDMIQDADIIFIQAGDRAQNILEALTLCDNLPYTIVIGTAPYASAYGVKAIVDLEELALAECYATPEYLVDDRYIEDEDYGRDYLFYTIDYDYSNGPDQEWKGHPQYEQQHTNGWAQGSYIVFKNVRFVDDATEVKIKTAHKVNTGSVKVLLDGLDGPVVADFANVPTNASYTEYQEITKPALTEVEGVHDVYVYCYTSAFQNFYTLEFVTYGETSMNAFTWADLSDEVDFTGDIITIDSNDYVGYSVDFGTESAYKSFILEAAAPEGTNGKVVMSDTDNNVIAEFDLTDADGNFKKINGLSNIALSGIKDLVLTYEGDGNCSFKTVKFTDYIEISEKLGIDNYTATSGAVNANGYFGGLGETSKVNYVQWSNIYFDDEDALWNLTIEYAFPAHYAAPDIIVYADEIGGPVIAKAVAVNQSNMGWENFKTITVPVTYMPEGYHDIYVVAAKGDYSSTLSALNFKGLQFSKYNGTEKYRVDYRTITKAQETTPKTVNAVLTFVKDETTPANYIFAAALYDKTTKQLKDVKMVNGTTVDGLNTASIVYNYSDVVGYEYKYFVWDGTTLMPLQAQAFSNAF